MITQQRIVTEKTDARKKFGRFKSEKPKAIRHMKKDKDFEELIQIWEECLYSGRPTCILPDEDSSLRYILPDSSAYSYAEEFLGNIDLSAEKIEMFAGSLIAFQGHHRFPDKAGGFLSVLINKSSSMEFDFDFSRFSMPITELGYLNRKKITISGDMGEMLAIGMQGGILTVNGNVGPFAGYGMNGGILRVSGDAEGYVGQHMGGGEIHIGGECERCEEDPSYYRAGGPRYRHILGGKIFIRGKQIYP